MFKIFFTSTSLKKTAKIISKNTFSSISKFSGAKRGPFTQLSPTLGNQYDDDPFLRETLQLEIPPEHFKEIDADLRQFGHRVSTDIFKLHLECERVQPHLEMYDAWGVRVDNLIVSDAWKQMKSIAAKEGLVSLAYGNERRKHSIYSRLYQMSKLYLYGPSSGLFGCPLAMTDGAAKTIETLGVEGFKKEAFERLTTRDPTKFWTSGQWMTEKRGGSDVAQGTETYAVKNAGLDANGQETFKLYGYKWFSSATDSDMTITLARMADKSDGENPSKGLTMFFAKTRNEDGTLNGIEIHKLKNKLGTRQLPTAELLLDGTHAYRMSEVDNGISRMAGMLNITRIHNSLTAVSNMRRLINFAKDYAHKRKAFGKLIIDHDLHINTLTAMETECRASFLTLILCAKLLGKIECNEASKEETELFRLIVPLLKLYTAKQSIAVVSEGLEAHGGQGYIEDTGLPTYLRDAQVLSIWEGTTNILSLDVLRSLQKTKGDSLAILFKYIHKVCENGKKMAPLSDSCSLIMKQCKSVGKYIKESESDLIQASAREISFSLYRLLTASLIVERCLLTDLDDLNVILLKRWCFGQDLAPVVTCYQNEFYNSKLNRKFF